jgi:hypothetical protein
MQGLFLLSRAKSRDSVPGRINHVKKIFPSQNIFKMQGKNQEYKDLRLRDPQTPIRRKYNPGLNKLVI